MRSDRRRQGFQALGADAVSQLNGFLRENFVPVALLLCFESDRKRTPGNPKSAKKLRRHQKLLRNQKCYQRICPVGEERFKNAGLRREVNQLILPSSTTDSLLTARQHLTIQRIHHFIREE